jgi:crotonobetainyl-CoA:carnitine CoA-transferase CaiB-like acyl-CoA transferase
MRLQNQVELDETVSQWTRQHTKQEAMQLVSGVGVPAGTALDTAEIQNDPNFEASGILQTIHRPSVLALPRSRRCSKRVFCSARVQLNRPRASARGLSVSTSASPDPAVRHATRTAIKQ